MKIKLFFFKADSSSSLLQHALAQKEKSDKLRNQLLEINLEIDNIKKEAKELELALQKEEAERLSEAATTHEEMIAMLEQQHEEHIEEIMDKIDAEIATLDKIFMI